MTIKFFSNLDNAEVGIIKENENKKNSEMKKEEKIKFGVKIL